MMPFLLAEYASVEKPLPLHVFCVGSHEQRDLERPAGYPAHQLFLTRSGKGLFRLTDGREFKLAAGMGLLLPAHVGHSYHPGQSGDIWDLGFVAFSGGASGALLEQMNELVLHPFEAPNFNGLWQQLESLWHLINQNGEQAYWESSRRMYDMLLTILEGQAPARKPSKKLADQPNRGLQAAVQLIHDHYDERLLLANVARAAGYSIQHFHRLFVGNYGVSPQQYISQLRMRRSLQLFADYPGITVESVAEKLGMDTSYFIKLFKRTYGVTPKKYAKD